jgi:feruloyl-CoA synthase
MTLQAETLTQAIPFRDPRFAPRRLDVERRADGSMLLTNPAPIWGPFATMIEPLVHWADLAPHRPWLAERSGEGWRDLSYLEAHQQVMALAGGLRSLGVVGERPLLILARNGIDHALITYAAMSQGMPAAPVSPQYGLPGANLTRLAHAVELLKPAAVFTEDAMLFDEALTADFLAGLPVIASRNARSGDVPFADLLKAAPIAATANADSHAKYLLTSGSTGRPKAVICRHRNIAANSAQLTSCFDDPDPPIQVNSAPWSHSLGANTILHGTAHRGGTLYIDAGQPVTGRFGETVRNLREIAPTFHYMVPAGWMLLAGELERDEQLARTFFSRVRLLQYGGANLSQEYCDRIQACAVRTVGEKISFSSGYGATETGPTAAHVHWINERMGLMGLPIPGTSVKLVPEAGKLEFRVKGPQVTSGYLGQPELSAAAFDEEGFYQLGDAARLNDPDDPSKGLAYDGRLSENFKLASGTFVSVGEVRIAAVGAVGDMVSDAVVCGEGRAQVGLMFYPKPGHSPEEIAEAVRAGVARLNAAARSAGGRVARALVLDSVPDPHAGEITEKGYIAQTLARSLRAEDVERLFADPRPAGVMAF